MEHPSREKMGRQQGIRWVASCGLRVVGCGLRVVGFLTAENAKFYAMNAVGYEFTAWRRFLKIKFV
jgi:hypothetical protein